MKKILLTLMVALGTIVSAEAQEYKTPGDGTTWTLEKLAEAGTYGIEKDVDPAAFSPLTPYVFHGVLTISEGDKFVMDSKVMLRMGDDARITIEGEANFAEPGMSSMAVKTVVTRDADTDQPYGIVVYSPGEILMSSMVFEYAGLRFYGEQNVTIMDCEFRYHNAKSASYAVAFGTTNSTCTVSSCTFEQCQRSAIGSGANIPVNLTVENCQFIKNGTTNANYPQLNLTVGEQVTIRGCEIQGDPEHTMVGGLVVANMVGIKGDIKTLIEDNNIYDNRYGVALYVTQNAIVRNNTIKDNNNEVNPMNGGSGINIYDPYYSQNTTITGNWIEGNLWGITVVGGNDINIGKTDDPTADDYNPGQNTFLNNGFDGNVYDLYNNSTNTVYAQGNIWKTATAQTQEAIEDCIFHMNDDVSLGEVIFMPFAEDTGIAALHAAEASEDVFTLDGMRIDNLSNAPRGIVVVKTNEQVKKLLSR